MRRKRSDPTPPLGGSWRGCTWCLGPHSWCARHPSRSLRTWQSPSRTWMTGMTGSTGRTLQEDIPLQRRPLWCMRKGMLGARSMTLSTVENHWWRPWRTSRRTSFSGLVRSTRESPRQRPKATLPRARARPRTHLVRPWVFTNHNGRSRGRETRKGRPAREVERPKAKAKKGRRRASQTGPLTGRSGIPSRWATAVTSISTRHVRGNAADPTTAQSMGGSVMLHHPSTQQPSAHTNPNDRPPPQVPLALQRGGQGPDTQAPASGPKDDALDACIHAYHPHLSPHVISVDNRRDPGSIGNDMLQDQPYNLLCSLPSQGQILFVCGGVKCRTWSILRWFPKPNAPPPVRGRSEAEVWGLEALTDQVQQDVDDDSVLMLRQFYLTSLAYQGLEQRHPPIKGGCWVEHPSDPSTTSCMEVLLHMERPSIQGMGQTPQTQAGSFWWVYAWSGVGETDHNLHRLGTGTLAPDVLPTWPTPGRPQPEELRP